MQENIVNKVISRQNIVWQPIPLTCCISQDAEIIIYHDYKFKKQLVEEKQQQHILSLNYHYYFCFKQPTFPERFYSRSGRVSQK